MRVLVAGDRLKDVKSLCEDLEVNRHEVLVDLSGLNGLSHALNAELDVILLMSAHPGEQTWQKLETLRASGASVPVFVLAARGDLRARVAALDCGADDYLVMPVVFDELRARIRAVLRRTQHDQASRLQAWGVAMDLVARRVTRKGRSLDLTDREFELLKCLMRRQGEVVSRQIIAQEDWPSGKRSVTIRSPLTSRDCGVRWAPSPDGSRTFEASDICFDGTRHCVRARISLPARHDPVPGDSPTKSRSEHSD
jgi:DNA-binding response OmpR family regulator